MKVGEVFPKYLSYLASSHLLGPQGRFLGVESMLFGVSGLVFRGCGL